MKFGDINGAGVNTTHCRVIPSLICKAWHPDDIAKLVVWRHHADGGAVRAELGRGSRGAAGKRTDRGRLPQPV